MEVPVRKGVDVPETLGVAGAVGNLGASVVILNDTSPEAVAIGFAECFALLMSIVLYLTLRGGHLGAHTFDRANL